MSELACLSEGCEERGSKQGYCNSHYNRLYRLGVLKPKIAKKGAAECFLREHVGWSSGECLLWPFRAVNKGYGVFVTEGVQIFAHRWMCAQKRGAAPFDGALAIHSCGNGHKGCVNPNHLRWGTYQDNSNDRVTHGGSGKGETNPNALLDEASVIAIWNDLRATKIVAAQYGVSKDVIQKIRRRATYSNLTKELGEQLYIKPRYKLGPRKTGPKLKSEQAIAIYNDPRAIPEIAPQYNVSESMVYQIKAGRTWSQVTGHNRQA